MALSNTQPNGIKQIIRGKLTIGSGMLTNTATITAVDTQKSELRVTGVMANSGDSYGVNLELTNATTLTGTKVAGRESHTYAVGYELTERW